MLELRISSERNKRVVGPQKGGDGADTRAQDARVWSEGLTTPEGEAGGGISLQQVMRNRIDCAGASAVRWP